MSRPAGRNMLDVNDPSVFFSEPVQKQVSIRWDFSIFESSILPPGK
jgi:hypothetical protein